ncbi:glycogen-binding subunit 76A isoform X2 [Microplitis mediator]|nr:glycogen-binding subunit 76A isoform X2 [Microplitis mediator]XP_057321719.1 glycogen-binding subunit 76A isoform X2 [Microplitis mediator]XP_057321720.1 glycogen-binding subunit 76A isoform X2 [Microplitis mediator]XP_057321721.1 glycogen-binding subunit 76A isoform X2 [Microplitis mediator]
MGSTDSPDDNHCAGGSSCGLVSSLFPTICRGRAEAFARRLHRRLTSLNGTDAETNYDDDDDIEENYNNDETCNENKNSNKLTTRNPVKNHVYQRQPHHTSESDLYFDFDLSPDLENGDTEIGSPDQVLNAAEIASLLVNHSDILKANKDVCDFSSHTEQPEQENNLVYCDSESGCGFSSPLNGTPSDDHNNEIYFDPVSSDNDKTRSDCFYDPINSSESDVCHASNDKTKSDSHKPPGRRRIDLHKSQKTQDTSESSSSVKSNLQQLDELNKKSAVTYSSEESLDNASSLDTTSPSHESLWSTFDDSTVSLQNDSLSTPPLPDTISKSYSDSELTPHTRLPEINVESASSSDEVDCFYRNNHNNDKIKSSDLVLSSNDLSAASTGDSFSTDTSSIDKPDALVTECPLDEQSPSTIKPLNNVENLENISDEINGMRIQETSSQDSDPLVNNKDKAISNLEIEENEEIDEKKNEEEDEEGHEPRPLRVRRCSSLKTGKTPPGTPGRKKIVRFADALGLDLADVRTFLDEIPKVPNSAFSDLSYDQLFHKDSSPGLYDSSGSDYSRSNLNTLNIKPVTGSTGMKFDTMLVPLFQQPGGLPSFMDLVRERQVCLENVIVQDPLSMCIQGTVRVKNLDFHKSVHIRYSLDSWKSYSDLQALYLQNSCDGFSDKFTFQLYCRPLKVGAKLELAVRFQCKGVQYWDNNSGFNYCFQCLPTSQAINYIPITSSQNCYTNNWSMNFY